MNVLIHLVVYFQMTVGITTGIIFFQYNLFGGLSVICMAIVGIGLNALLYKSTRVKNQGE